LASADARRRNAIRHRAKRSIVPRCGARFSHAEVLFGRSDSWCGPSIGSPEARFRICMPNGHERKRARTSAFRVAGTVEESFPPAMCLDGKTVRPQQFTHVNGSDRGPDLYCYSSEFKFSRPWRQVAGGAIHRIGSSRRTAPEETGRMNRARPQRRPAYGSRASVRQCQGLHGKARCRRCRGDAKAEIPSMLQRVFVCPAAQ
jgi:hypothetical protein